MKTLISEFAIKEKVEELAQQLSIDYKQKNPVLIGVLKGSFIFLSDLARAMDFPLQLDFMSVSSYGDDTKSSGIVRIIKDLDDTITDRHVVIVEDILDTGLTLGYLVEMLGARKPASIRICTLLSKNHNRKTVHISADYVGFEIEDKFVVGYGLDYRGYFRNLPNIAELEEEDLALGFLAD
ncbi:MAG: hypoxanthine phosphoribosyltransferase [Eubacteriaceae bacterium]|nr:hypoxanthine phosphoribosyltransferase [Eubacteriaceae bacterium]